MTECRFELKTLCKVLLDAESTDQELFDAVDQLFRIYSEASKIDPESDTMRADVFLPTGKAIGPFWAAMCVKEYMRTRQFLRGIHAALKEAQVRFSGECIHVLYAGTGPFATLAIPFTALFTPQEIRFTFLEINPESVWCLKQTARAFEAEEYISEIVQCDATQYHAKPGTTIHMVISETMLNALQKEPQVAISLNLAPQLAERGIFIPQNIRIDAALMSPELFNKRILAESDCSSECHRVIDTIFELNHDTALAYRHGFPVKTVNLPTDWEATFNVLCLFTHIQVFDDICIDPWQCSLTLPQKLLRITDAVELPITATFQYVIQERCGFNFKIETT